MLLFEHPLRLEAYSLRGVLSTALSSQLARRRRLLFSFPRSSQALVIGLGVRGVTLGFLPTSQLSGWSKLAPFVWELEG